MSYSARLILGTILVLTITVLVLVIGVERSLRQDLEQDLRLTLEREATLIREALPADSLAWQDAATTFAKSAKVRVTIIDRSGRVRAESDVPADQLSRIENHASRPEVQEAVQGKTGWDRRKSVTIGAPLMYVAVPGEPGVIRVAMPLFQVDRIVSSAQRPVWLGAAFALAFGILLALISGRRATRPLTEIRAAARAITRGEPPHFPHAGTPDVDALVTDLREMHYQLTNRIEGLKKAQAETAAIVDSMVEGVLSADAKGHVLTANPAARRLLGYSDADQLPDLPLLFRAKSARELVIQALGGASVSDKEIELGDRTYLLNARPLAQGGGGGAVVVLHDLTHLRRLETIRRDFVANVSHELKTPLTAISGYAETLLDHRPEPTMEKRFLETILGNARRMQRLVDDQLDLSRIESGNWTPSPETVDLALAADEAWHQVAPRVAPGPRFEVALDPQVRSIRVDPDALKQIFRNLLENAIRHTPPTGTITLRSSADGDGVRISVADTGSGISREHLSRIFERFYRVDPSRSRDQGGTGLGLSIVKHMVEAHGGRVWAESELGQGATLHIWLDQRAGSRT